MRALFDFIFNNIILVIIVIIAYYIYKQYKELKSKDQDIRDVFTKTLDKYLETKINEAKKIANSVLDEYNQVELIRQEVERINLTVEKGITGTINDKVNASNLLNKYKLNKKIDVERYPNVTKLENIGTFTDEDMGSIDNGVALARREYNAKAFRYNEMATGFPMQYLTKLFRLNPQFSIFDAPKTSNYEEKYEVFEEEEPEINSLDVLNQEKEVESPEVLDEHKPLIKEEVVIDHSDLILKPSVSIEEKKEQK